MEYLVVISVLLILTIDGLLLPMQSRNSLKFLVVLSALSLSIFGARTIISSSLSKVGLYDPLEALVFLMSFLLLRELLISRSRQYSFEERFSQLVRENAIREVKST